MAMARQLVRLPLPLRIAVPMTALVGALAVWWSGAMSMPVSMPVTSLLAVAVAVGGVLWLFAPKVGFWTLGAAGVLTVAWSAGGLASGGTAPWMLTAFWGGSAALLAALLHLSIQADSPDRSAWVTVGAVGAILLLSALGLGQYMRLHWTDAERAVLREVLSCDRRPATLTIAAAPRGVWMSRWSESTDPEAAVTRLSRELTAAGWRVDRAEGGSACALEARKGEYRCRIRTEAGPAAHNTEIEVIAYSGQ